METVSAGIDWLTMTLGVGAVGDQIWVNRGLMCLDDVVREGYELQYSNLLGYEGVKAGGCFVGSRQDTHMIQMSGRFADMFFTDLYRYDAHISRLDVQVSVKFKKMPKGIAKEAYRDAMAENQTIPIGRRRKIWLIVGSDGGDTCYIGSASSDARARIYNKEVQSEDPMYMRTWRYEVCLRNGQATSVSRDYATTSAPRVQFCCNFVAYWLEKRGVKTPWLFDEDYTPVPPVKTLPTDIERKLNWLKHQVSPTVEYLLTVMDKETILQLLGLS